MTTHFEHRNTSVLDSTADGSTTVAEQAASSPTRNRRRMSRWVAPVGIAIGAACIVGTGALLIGANAEPTPTPPAVADSDQGRSQRLVEESIDAALAANRPAATESDQGRSHRLVQESIDAALAANGN